MVVRRGHKPASSKAYQKSQKEVCTEHVQMTSRSTMFSICHCLPLQQPSCQPICLSALLLAPVLPPAQQRHMTDTMPSQHLPWEALVLVMQHLPQEVRLGLCSQVREGGCSNVSLSHICDRLASEQRICVKAPGGHVPLPHHCYTPVIVDLS